MSEHEEIAAPQVAAVLPCPFCGQQPERWVMAGITAIECKNNDCSVSCGTSHAIERIAVNRWNTRGGTLQEAAHA